MTTGVQKGRAMKKQSKFAKQYGPWALVTGASSGIGAEFARRLASEGFNVALAARRGDLLQIVAKDIEQHCGVATRCVVVDLSEDSGIDHLDAELRDLDIGLVVSNAGTGQPGRFFDQARDDILARFRLNSMSNLNMAYVFGRRLQRRGGGGLILGGAMGAAHGLPFAAVDAGSKALVESLGQSLHIELKPQRIQIMTLVVPPTDTAIITKFGLAPADMPVKPMSVAQCVFEALRHFKQGRSISLPGAFNRFMSGIMPTGAMRVILGKMLERTIVKHESKVLEPRTAGH